MGVCVEVTLSNKKTLRSATNRPLMSSGAGGGGAFSEQTGRDTCLKNNHPATSLAGGNKKCLALLMCHGIGREC